MIDLDIMPASKLKWIEHQNLSQEEKWDIATRETEVLQQRFELAHPDLRLSPFEDEYNPIDGIIINKNDMLAGVYEAKTRNCDLSHLLNVGWILTNHKVNHGKVISDVFGIPFYGIVYCIYDKTLVVAELFDGNGKNVTPFIVKAQDETSAGIRGGQAIRTNAYFDISSAKIFRGVTQ